MVGSDDGSVYALNPDGSLRWWYVVGSGVRCSPAIGADGLIYVGSTAGYLYALRGDGVKAWDVRLSGSIVSSPGVHPEGVLTIGCSDGVIRAIAVTPGGLASTPWPRFRHDLRGTGRAGDS